jgi:hypothetical protein
MLSVLEKPESDAAIRSGAVGAGGVVNSVTARLAEATLVLPAMSVSFAVTVLKKKFASDELVIDQLPEPSATPVPSTVVPLSNRVTVAPASAPLPVNTGVVTLVMLSVFDEPESLAAVRSGALGAAAVVSIVTFSPADAPLTLPATSVAVAVMLCVAWLSAEVVML